MPIKLSENTLNLLPVRRIAAWLLPLLIGGFFLLVFQADRGALPRWLATIQAFPGGDKLGHFLIAGLLSLTLNLALSGRVLRLGRFSVLLGGLVVLLLMTAEEFTQLYFPTRTFSWLDLSSDLLGILLAGCLVRQLMRRAAFPPP